MNALTKKTIAFTLILYVFLSACVLFPVIPDLKNKAVGYYYSDVHSHLWCLWWVSTSLVNQYKIPTETNLINYPRGGTLFPAMPLDSIITLPLFIMGGVAVAYNSIFFFHLTMSAFAGFLLVYYLTRKIPSSIIAGIICGFSPYMLTHPVESGEAETGSIEWIILFILFLLKSIREKSWINPVLCGLFAFFAVFSSFYQGEFIAVFAFLFLIFYLLFVRNRSKDLVLSDEAAKTDEDNSKMITFPLVKRIALALLVSLVLVIPLMATVRKTIDNPRSILPRQFIMQDRGSDSFIYEYKRSIRRHASLSEFVIWGKKNLSLVNLENSLASSVYVGYTLIILSIFALFRKRKLLYFLFISSLFYVCLSVGPFFQVSNNFAFEKPVNFIFVLMFKFFPSFAKVITPSRFAVMIMISVAILAANGIIYLSERFKIREVLLSFVVGVFILVEFFVLSPAPFPATITYLGVPRHCRDLKEEKGEFGVIDLPVTVQGSSITFRRIFYYQTIHHKNLPYKIAMLPDLLTENLFLSTAFEMEESLFTREESLFTRGKINPEGDIPLDLDKEVDSLHKMNFRYVILHKNFYRQKTLEKVGKLCRKYLGEPVKVYKEDNVEVYRIMTPGAMGQR